MDFKSLKEQSIIIIVDARVLSPSGGYAKLKFFQALLGLDTKLYKTAVQFENSIDDVGSFFMQLISICHKNLQLLNDTKNKQN